MLGHVAAASQSSVERSRIEMPEFSFPETKRLDKTPPVQPGAGLTTQEEFDGSFNAGRTFLHDVTLVTLREIRIVVAVPVVRMKELAVQGCSYKWE